MCQGRRWASDGWQTVLGGGGARVGDVETVEMERSEAVDITGMSGEHEGERGVSWDKMGWGPSGLI